MSQEDIEENRSLLGKPLERETGSMSDHSPALDWGSFMLAQNGNGIRVWQQLDLLLALTTDSQSHWSNSRWYRLRRQPGTTNFDHYQLTKNIAQESKML